MAARARRRVRGLTPKMVMMASLGERPVPPNPPLSLSSEGGCGFGLREGERVRRRVRDFIIEDQASFLHVNKTCQHNLSSIPHKLWKQKRKGKG